MLPAVRGMKVLSLQAACRADSLAGPLLLVEPTVADVSVQPQWGGGGGAVYWECVRWCWQMQARVA